MIKELEDLGKILTDFRLKMRLLYLIIKDDICHKTLGSFAQHLDVSVLGLGRFKTTHKQEGLSNL